jgi:DNA-binding NarL/FixJ family response regulator
VRANFLRRALARIPAIPAAGTRKAVKQALGGLTEREREIAARIAEGDTNRQIGEALFIAERTVERHVSNILLKLDLHTRGEIASWAHERLKNTPKVS